MAVGIDSAVRIVIIVPTYNERENIGLLIPALESGLAGMPHDIQILVVDDNSPDGTAAEVESQAKEFSNVHLLTGERRGLGAAYLRGMRHALGRLAAQAVMEIDADFSHQVEDVPRLIEALDEGYDFVIGSRYIRGGKISGNWSFLRRLQSRIGNLVARAVGGLWSIRDCTAGFRAIRADLLRRIDLDGIVARGYSFQVQLLYQALKRNARVKELPVEFVDRVRGQTKLGLNPKERLDFILDALAIRFEKLETFLKFAAVGILGVIVNLGAFSLLTRGAGLDGRLASPIAAELAIISNFTWNNIWTFMGRGVGSAIHTKFLKFNAVSLTALLLNFSVFLFLHQYLHVYDLLSQFVGIIAAVAWNYLVNVKWTWGVTEE